MKTERESAGDFLVVYILWLKVLITWIITKRSKGYVPYIYKQIKYQSITVYVKKRGDA